MPGTRIRPVDRITGLEQRVTVLEEYGVGGEGDHIIGEQLVGGINGANKIFTTPNNFISSTTEVVWNGIVVARGSGGDYIESGDNTLIFEEAPLSGDILRINYWKKPE